MDATVVVKGVNVAGNKVDEVSLHVSYTVEEMIKLLEIYPSLVEALIAASK